MNRNQRRQASKNMGLAPAEELTLKSIMVLFEDGKTMALDISKVVLLDRETGKPLFNEILEQIKE